MVVQAYCIALMRVNQNYLKCFDNLYCGICLHVIAESRKNVHVKILLGDVVLLIYFQKNSLVIDSAQ